MTHLILVANLVSIFFILMVKASTILPVIVYDRLLKTSHEKNPLACKLVSQ